MLMLHFLRSVDISVKNVIGQIMRNKQSSSRDHSLEDFYILLIPNLHIALILERCTDYDSKNLNDIICLSGDYSMY
jgi:hypothetical protein